MAFGWMLPAMREAFPAIAGDIEAITAAYRNGDLPLVRLAEEYLDGSFKHYESAAQSIGVSADTLAFVMSTVLSAALGSFVPKNLGGNERCALVKRKLPDLRRPAIGQFSGQTFRKCRRIFKGLRWSEIPALRTVWP